MKKCPKCKEISSMAFTTNKGMTIVYYQCPCGHKWSEKVR